MREKHVIARIKQCIAIAECSPCPRRKFGALLIDPVRNVILMDGYNGGPRGGGDICGGYRCLRDGLLPDDVTVTDFKGDIVGTSAYTPGTGTDDAYVRVKDLFVLDKGAEGSMGPRSHALGMWLHDAEDVRNRLLAENPPIKSGTRYEIGCHHAEMNVITNAAARGVATDGAWLIVTGEPCILCSKLIHHAGIARVLCVRGGFLGGDDGPNYLRANGVEVEYVAGPPDPRSQDVQPLLCPL